MANLAQSCLFLWSPRLWPKPATTWLPLHLPVEEVVHRVVDVVPIVRDDRVHPDATGVYSFDVETGDGIVRSEQGGPGGSQQGKVSFTFPDGQVFDLSFVADANGYQPESPFLPVAPAFPHPIPQFVLDQIEFARQQDEAKAREAARGGSVSTPSRSYGAPV
ncbi:cuticle protein AM/CP1114-like [Oratosquilla oratoria]|uniref:cuticle protein AM/CP1114-like n=1 Tax=Oratosquilla oratoria TaxID=337810 RepID=UPI003F76204F